MQRPLRQARRSKKEGAYGVDFPGLAPWANEMPPSGLTGPKAPLQAEGLRCQRTPASLFIRKPLCG